MERLNDGGILSAAGFRAGAARCGIKSAEGQPDVALLVADGPAAGAGVFTTNRFAAPSVLWNRQRLPAADVRAVVVNSGNANACTGKQGTADVRASAEAVAGLLSCRPQQVCVLSTGIIGHLLPMDRLLRGIRSAHAGLGSDPRNARAAEQAIMTTDTRPKAAAVRSAIQGKPFQVGGMAKGSGMIAPNMATMLAFVTTDARIRPDLLRSVLAETVDVTFNRITVDGDSSTNDSVIALASGAAGAEVTGDKAGLAAFREALHAVLSDLSLQIVRDGEGATKVIEVEAAGAATAAEAEAVARAVAESQLFKCAVYGGDPNWGRIVCAVGYSGAEVDPDRVGVTIGETRVFANGRPTDLDADAEMRTPPVRVRIDLGRGTASSVVWGCDLTEGYVQINAHYHT